MKKFLLIINTTIQNKIFVALAKSDKFYKKNIFTAKSEKLLPLIDKILKSGRVGPGAIGGIIVVTGPGSFTAVRQGLVLANTFGYILKIPVVGVRADEFKNDDALLKIGYEKIKKVGVGGITLPFYGREPNITTPKPKL